MNVNPITRLDYPDPDVIRVEDTYYMAVSYTHLDVYKRQSLWFNRTFMFFGHELYTTLARATDVRIYRPDTLAPVSYTHLDVYKRQLWHS